MRRALALTAVALLAGLALSGCTKPNPGVSVWAGTQSIHEPASCWSNTASIPIDTNACAAALTVLDKAGKIPTLTVTPGAPMGISVDRVVAKQGWTAKLGANNLTPAATTSTYVRITYPQLAGLAKKNQLVILASGPTTGTYRGVWVFQTVEQ